MSAQPADALLPAVAGWRQGLRDAWTLARPYWTARGERRALALLAAVVALTLAGVALNVRFSAWNNRFYDALQNHDLAAFWQQIGVFGALAAAYIVAAVYRQYLQQRLQMHWRAWTTERLARRWLQPGAAYRTGSVYRGTAAGPDNPDQRIAEDVQQFVTGSLGLSLGLLNAVVTLVSFVAILWHLSGDGHVAVGGIALAVPGYMVWVALGYAGGGSWLTQRIGRPLVPLGVQQQRAEADLRYALVQVRDHAEAIALAGGEPAEAARIGARVEGVRQNWWRLIGATKRLTWFSAGYGQLAVVFPLLAAAPRYFAGRLALGGLMQTAQAFGQVQGALSWFIDAYGTLADWRATVHRLAGFEAALQADARAQAADAGRTRHGGDAILFDGVCVQAPGGRPLLELPAERLVPGTSVLLTGRSGGGKGGLLRALAGLWPLAHGRLRLPRAARLMFVPQRPYLPAGTLAEALAWPAPATAHPPEAMRLALRRAGLPALAGEIDSTADWGRRLSPGEQQRLQCARVLLAAPDWVFLDEATAALDEAHEARLMHALAEALPRTTIVSAAHRRTLRPFHALEWRLADGGVQALPIREHAAQTGATPG